MVCSLARSFVHLMAMQRKKRAKSIPSFLRTYVPLASRLAALSYLYLRRMWSRLFLCTVYRERIKSLDKGKFAQLMFLHDFLLALLAWIDAAAAAAAAA